MRPVDLTDPRALALRLDEADPDVLIHLAAISSAEVAYRDPELARAVNVEGTNRLAAWAAAHDRRILYISSDLVFGGSKAWNREVDRAVPALEYGRTKLDAEPAVLATRRGLVARLSLLYGPSRADKPGFFERALTALRAGTPQSFFSDEFRSPLDYRTAASILIRLAESDVTGLLHAGGPERLSRFEMMQRTAVVLGIDPHLVRSNRRADVPQPELRPADVSLDSSLLRSLLLDLDVPRIEAALAALT
jgi:dTDP-4-dehydrorhamnose reductase